MHCLPVFSFLQGSRTLHTLQKGSKGYRAWVKMLQHSYAQQTAASCSVPRAEASVLFARNAGKKILQRKQRRGRQTHPPERASFKHTANKRKGRTGATLILTPSGYAGNGTGSEKRRSVTPNVTAKGPRAEHAPLTGERCRQAAALALVGERCQTTLLPTASRAGRRREGARRPRGRQRRQTRSASAGALRRASERGDVGSTATATHVPGGAASSTWEQGKERGERTERKDVKNMFSLFPSLFCCVRLFHRIHPFPSSALLDSGFFPALCSFQNISSSFLFFLVLLLLLHLSCFPMLSLPGCPSSPLSAAAELCQS